MSDNKENKTPKAKAPKAPVEPKVAWEAPKRAFEAVNIMKEFVKAGDKKVLAFFVREAIACREQGKTIREALSATEVATPAIDDSTATKGA